MWGTFTKFNYLPPRSLQYQVCQTRCYLSFNDSVTCTFTKNKVFVLHDPSLVTPAFSLRSYTSFFYEKFRSNHELSTPIICFVMKQCIAFQFPWLTKSTQKNTLVFFFKHVAEKDNIFEEYECFCQCTRFTYPEFLCFTWALNLLPLGSHKRIFLSY